MLKSLERLLKKAKGKFLLVPVEYTADEPMEAWSKIDRSLDSAYTDVHVDTVQRMFNQMLTYYNFSIEQRNSPLIAGMQEKINSKRAVAVITRK